MGGQDVISRRHILSLGAAAVTAHLAPSARAQSSTAPVPPPLAVYAQSAAFDEIALSPDGSKVAYVTHRGDDKYLAHFDVVNPEVQYDFIGKGKVRGLMWSDNENLVLTSSATDTLRYFGTEEFFLAEVINLKTRSFKTLFDDKKDYFRISLGPVARVRSAHGHDIVACGFRKVGEGAFGLWRFAADGTTMAPVAVNLPNDLDDWVISPDGRLVAYSRVVEDGKAWSLNYNIAGDAKKPVIREILRIGSHIVLPQLFGLGRSQDTIVIWDTRPEVHGFAEIGADGVVVDVIDADHAGEPGRQPLFHPRTGLYIGMARQDETLTYDSQDAVVSGVLHAVAERLGPKLNFRISEFSEDPRKLIINAAGPDQPGTYVHADFTQGLLTSIGDDYPAVPAAWLTTKQPILYTAGDGLPVHGYVTLPPFKTASNVALVVMPHGGPQSRDFNTYDWQVQALASRGYAVLQPNFRGSSGYGDDFVAAGYGEWGRKMQSDLSDGIQYLVSEGLVDPKRVAIVGASYGGYAALAGATLDEGIYRCAISIAGISNLEEMINYEVRRTGSDYSARVLYWKRFMGETKSLRALSPLWQAARASCPVLLIHGSDDTVVPILQSQSMEKALKAAGKSVELVTYPGQDHWEMLQSAREAMISRIVDFLTEHNPA